MEKVYLLLRNNQQSGPFTIGELLQQQLRSSDMIWIEGKSTAWTYLTELELTPFLKKDETHSNQPTMNAPDEIERKAEELRQRILTSPPKTYFPDYTTEIETYSSPYKLDDEIQFVDYRKEKRIKKNTAIGELMLTCLVVGLFMVGIYKGKSFLGAKQKIQNSVATQLTSGDQHTAKKSTPINQASVISEPDTTKHTDTLIAIQKPKQKIKKNVTDSSNSVITQTSPAENANQADKKLETSVQLPSSASHENIVKKDVDTPAKKEVAAAVPAVKANNESQKEEKRGFLRGLFKKKKKED